MLDKHLIVVTRPLANKKNIIYYLNYRITVLQDSLFRIEQSDKKEFLDEATQSIWFRDMEPQRYSVNENKDSLEIKTNTVVLKIFPERSNCRIVLDGKEIKINNEENLLGTTRTLDGCNGKYFVGNGRKVAPTRELIKLNPGVCSRNGVAVIDDTNSLILKENGELALNIKDHTDEYIFAYGNDYRKAVQALYLITGKVPLLPKYSLGNWWSRYYGYTQKGYMTLLNRFVEHDVPLTVATLDMDWHYYYKLDEIKHITELGRNTEYFGFNDGWTGYSWNTLLFPDYKKMLKEIHNMNLRVTLNLHPADGVRWFEDCYEEFAKSMNVDPKSGKQIKFDFADTDYINNYFKVIHKPYEKDGVDFWWIDWQQGEKSKLPGLDPLWALNHYHYLDHLKNHRRGLILSRYAGIGSHRYPLGFSGDSFVSWETLDYLPYFTSTATNAGYINWSHDIGGHQQGLMDENLYVRFIQLGVFSPINRLHCQSSETMSKEPWLYKNGSGLVAEEFLRLRHKMIPYLYSMNYQSHLNGRGLIEPLYYEVKEDDGYKFANEFIFAIDLFALPITTPNDKFGLGHVKGYLPKGRYIDFFTNDIYSLEEGKEIDFYRPLESFPLLMKEGSIVPLSMDKGNSINNPKVLNIVTSSGNNSYDFYEDNNNEEYTITHFNNKREDGMQLLNIKTGKEGIYPQERKLIIDYRDLEDGEVEVFEDGKNIMFEQPYHDNVRICILTKPNSNYEIRIKFKEKTIEQIKLSLAHEMISMQHYNNFKSDLYREIQKIDSLSIIRIVIENNEHLSPSQKGRLLEKLM